MAKSRGILGASGGGFAAGLLLLVGGLTVQHSQASMVMVRPAASFWSECLVQS